MSNSPKYILSKTCNDRINEKVVSGLTEEEACRAEFNERMIEQAKKRGMSEQGLKGLKALLKIAASFTPEDVEAARHIVDAHKAGLPVSSDRKPDRTVVIGIVPQ